MEKILNILSSVLLFSSLNVMWITLVTSSAGYQEKDEFESVVDIPILTPASNTEQVPFNNMDVTSETSAGGDIYDQISPSRYPTTPISREYFHGHLKRKFLENLETPSTIPTIMNVPLPFY